MFQSSQFIPTLTTFEDIEVPLDFDAEPKEERRTWVWEVLITIGLEDRVHKRVTEFSGGE